jgi:glyoxylase-like metal-dependent hydrolase (beta-lactamase superfamily II)
MTQTETFDAGGDANRSYLVFPGTGEEAWCVDPSFAAPLILRRLKERGAKLTHVLLTHTHGDHVATLDMLSEACAPTVWAHPVEASRIPGARPLPGEGPMPSPPGVEVLFTPGHTPGGVCYRIGEDLFTGDTLFVDWVGRADLPGGDARALFASLAKLRNLPGGLRIRPGHHYGAVESRTLAEEVSANRFLACGDFGAFLALLPELTS